MSAPQQFWEQLIALNRRVDNLIGRVKAAVEPSQPITREIPFFGEIEVLYQNLPRSFGGTVPVGSDAIASQAIKQGQFTNKGGRVYINSMTMTAFLTRKVSTGSLVLNPRDERNPSDLLQAFPINWRWNFMTSIQQRWYSNDRRLLARSGGRQECGSRLSWREPLILEPMETLTFETELLSSGMASVEIPVGTNAVISLQLFGYRGAL